VIELLLQAERALSMGLVDQAERLYRQAADADPRNSIAVVGLARVALERGDDVLAWREAKRALTIDPENAAARRMVERFEEVWRHRGQAIPQASGASTGVAAGGVTSVGGPAGGVTGVASTGVVAGEVTTVGSAAVQPAAPGVTAGIPPALVPVEASQAWARITGEAATLDGPDAAPAESYGWPESDLRPDAETEPEDNAGRAADDGFPVAEDEAHDAAVAAAADEDDGSAAEWPPAEQEVAHISALPGLDRVRNLFTRKRE
jgi:hypothetical protein